MSNLIDRQAAIDAITNELDNIDHVPEWVFVRMKSALHELPSAEPEPIKIQIDHKPTPDELERLRKTMENAPIVLLQEPKTGHWLYSGENKIDRWTCDNCFITVRKPTKICPNCGAKMESEG